jgi:putative salt-induced outer membrane protein YdiY
MYPLALHPTPRSIVRLTFIVSIFCFSLLLRADTLELKGGDRLTGTAVKLENGKLTFKTAYAADPIVIAWDQVTKLSVDKPMILTTAKSSLTVTSLSTTSNGFEASTQAGPSAVAAVKALRSPADQAVYEKTLHPDWGHAWAINANASFALAKGNADTQSIGAGATAVRTTGKDKTLLNFSTLYSHDNTAKLTTTDSTGGGLRYDRNISPKIFAYGSGDFLNNGLQNLDLRSILSTGFGWHSVKDSQQMLDVFGGLSWTHEKYSTSTTTLAATNSFASLNLGETYNRKIGKPSVLTEQAIFYPNMSTPGNYEFTLTSGLTTRLTRLLSWNVNYTDNYTSFPPAGTKKNDTVFTTGIGVTFLRP